MLKGSHDESGKFKIREEEAHAPVGRKNGGTGAGGRTCRRKPGVPPGKHSTSAAVALEAEVSSGRNCEPKRHQARAKAEGRSSARRNARRDGATVTSATRDFDRASSNEKKESLGLEGPLYGRHLSKAQREALRDFIDAARVQDSVATICGHLQVHPRSYYRWKRDELKASHGGGAGRNKITPIEEKRVVAMAKKNPSWHCRRIAYQLEKKGSVFIGKTKVSEIMKTHGLNHPFEQKPARPVIEPADMLLHEPWRKNLLWGMDWTWVTVDGRFMYLLVLLDWYSRKILSWGFHPQVTKTQVVALVTDAVAAERIDLLPPERMKPTVVADHGSANASKYTKHNIEIQGLKLWLSGIGRPTGNARTERVIGTLKREEINLQEQYATEAEAKSSIGVAIWDYNMNRPNQGNGGHSPNAVHHSGRAVLMKRRENARQKAQELRRRHWEQESPPSGNSLT